MGRLQASTGLITGVPIQDTVKQLIAIEARPRDLIVSRNKDLTNQQLAVNSLLATVIAVQLSARNLGKASVFNKTTVTSSNPGALTATVTGAPPVGIHTFTPIQKAQAQQLLSSGFASKTDPIGAGALSFSLGGFVDKSLALSELNNGQGVQRGKIRVTDRSGDTAVVDLRYAQTVDDVLTALNTADGVRIQAVADGDAIRLIDESGGAGNLKVAEVNGGSTAADLGLSGINVAADEAVGNDVLQLYNGLSLARLNDGNGVNFSSAAADLQVQLHDGSTVLVDFLSAALAATSASGTTSAANGVDAAIELTADTGGADYNGVQLSFVDDPGVTKGLETVVYDDTDPQNKTLTVHIAAGQTTANDVITAINNDAVAGPLFTASAAIGGTGLGLVAVGDQAITAGGTDAVAAATEKTIGDVLTTINAADPAKLQAQLSADGDHIELIDLTSGGSAFQINDYLGGSAASDLGLTGAESSGTITSRRLRGGLKSPLLSSLKGGHGFDGGLGQLVLTDRSGVTDTIDLSSAETLDDVIDAINSANVGIKAGINNARNGIKLQDTTGAVASNLIVADGGDSLETATKLGIAVDDSATSVDSGSLDLQYVNRSTRLDKYDGGVAKGTFVIRDSNGSTTTVNTNAAGVDTLGDVIDAINSSNIGVHARINDQGDGIVVIDTAGGSGQLEIFDTSTGTTALDLGLLGTGVQKEINGVTKTVIEGSARHTVDISAADNLQDVVDKINALDLGVTANLFSDGSGVTPYRISLTSQTSGTAGEILVDASGAGFTFQEITKAQDALLQIGGDSQGGGILASSSDNHFDNVIDGVSLVVNDSSASPVTVTIESSDSSLVSTAQAFVDQYNKLAKAIADLTFFDPTQNTTGTLFGSYETLRVESGLSSLLSGRFFGVGSIQSLEAVGIGFNDDGTLSLDEDKLKAKFAADPESVTKFFTDEKAGFSHKVDALVETFAGRDHSLLVNRAQALQNRIDQNQQRIDFLNAYLDRRTEFLTNQFNNMEAAIAKLQNNLTAINSIQALPSLISSGSSSG